MTIIPDPAVRDTMSWTTLARRGEFELAWKISDAVLRQRAGRRRWHLPRHEQYVWDGTPLDGAHVVIRCYHGLGETIQFARYAPLVKEVAASVTAWAQPALIPLLRTVQGFDRLLPLHDDAPPDGSEIDVEIMALPHVFRSTLETLPARVPYINVPALDRACRPPRTGAAPLGT